MTLSGPYYTTESRASSQILSMPTSKAGREPRETPTPTPRSQQTGQIASEIYGRQSGGGLMFLARRPELTGQVLGGVRRPSHARETLLQRNRGPRPVRRGPEVLSLRLYLLDSGRKPARVVSQERRDRAEHCVTEAAQDQVVAASRGLVALHGWWSMATDFGPVCCPSRGAALGLHELLPVAWQTPPCMTPKVTLRPNKSGHDVLNGLTQSGGARAVACTASRLPAELRCGHSPTTSPELYGPWERTTATRSSRLREGREVERDLRPGTRKRRVA